MAIKTQQQYLEELMENYRPHIEAEKAAAGQIYDLQRKQTQADYESSMDRTARAYDEQERENAVQRFVNEQQIRTGLEAAGLSDSGLHRTGQMAVQLSYANQKAQIGKNRQEALDVLTGSLAESLAKIEGERQQSFAKIEADYFDSAQKRAAELYKADLDAENERVKLEIDRYKAETQRLNATNKTTKNSENNQFSIIKTNDGLLSYDFKGTLQENGVAIYYYLDAKQNLKTKYVDQNSGKTTTVDRWVNPFTTAQPNKDLFDGDGAYDPKKAFSNGYQPNNIDGDRLKKVGTIDLTATLGRTQNVYETNDGKCWVWSGKQNQYVRAVKQKTGWKIL